MSILNGLKTGSEKNILVEMSILNGLKTGSEKNVLVENIENKTTRSVSNNL